MSIIYGKDEPNRLFLAVYFTDMVYNIENMKEFPKDFKYCIYIGSDFVERFNTNGPLNSNEYSKTDNYNLEDAIEKFKIKMEIQFGRNYNLLTCPVFLRKNNKWYYVSTETDMLLIPCNGE